MGGNQKSIQAKIWEWVGKTLAAIGLGVGLIVGVYQLFEMMSTAPKDMTIIHSGEIVKLNAENASDLTASGNILADVLMIEGDIRVERDRLAIVANKITFNKDASLTLRRQDEKGGDLDLVTSHLIGGVIDVSGVDGVSADRKDGRPAGRLRVIAGLIEGTALVANGGDGRNGVQPGRAINGQNGDCGGFGAWRPARRGADGARGEDGGDGGAAGSIFVQTAGPAPAASAEKGQAGRGSLGGEGGKGGTGCTGLGGSQPSKPNGARGAGGEDGQDGASNEPQVAAQTSFKPIVKDARASIKDGTLDSNEMDRLLGMRDGNI